GRISIKEFLSVLTPQNCWLLLTRLTNQADHTKSVILKEALHSEDAARLFDSITEGRVTGDVRTQVLDLLQGHPLALTWAATLLANGDEPPARRGRDCTSQPLPTRSDPPEARRTLEWLMTRSLRGLDQPARQAMAAAALLAHAPFPLAAIDAALGDG